MTCMGAVSEICACCASYCVCPCCTSFSLLHSSCSSQSCCFNSCNSFSDFSILHLSLFLCMFLLSRCHLLVSISKASFIMSVSSLNLHLYFSSILSLTFLFPLLCASLLPSIVVDDGSLLDVASWYFTNHSTAMPTSSLSLEKL